jgi:hypothetical protein
MSESNQNFLKCHGQRSKFIAIGGVVVCAFTLGVVFGLPTVLQRHDSPDDANSSFAAFIPKNASNKSEQLAADSFMNSAGSDDSNHVPAEVDSISKPAHKLMANLRTKPTTSYEVDTLPSMRKLGNLFIEDNAIRLKLYWQGGYFWQEKREETW